jgi:hypothetical protein
MGLAKSDFIKKHLLNKAKGKDLAREVVRYDEDEIHKYCGGSRWRGIAGGTEIDHRTVCPD